MRYLILVDPVGNEAQLVSTEQAQAGLDWLNDGLTSGLLTAAEAYPATGGYMIMVADSVQAVYGVMQSYPLRDTVQLDVRELVSLSEGFATLIRNIAATVPYYVPPDE